MARNYTPRRCSKRWLDGDCPAGVLAILDHPSELDRYTIIYADVMNDGNNDWLAYLGTSADLAFSGHGQLKAHQVAEYRYRNKHRYARWSDLPEAVKNVVRRDLEN
jgi:hypothetical protein